MNDADKALRLLAHYLTSLDLTCRPDVYLSTKARAAPAIETWEETIETPESVDRSVPLTVAFIDLMPDANYEHPVQYAFINETSGDVYTVDATTPPNALTSEFQKIELEIPIVGEE